MTETELYTRIELLESKVAFQDLTIEELNQVVIQLQMESHKLTAQLRLLSKRLQAAQTNNIASPNEETPPPHY